MAVKRKPVFSPKSFLAEAGEGRSIGDYHVGQVEFSQGEPADAIFYIQKGNVKITVVSDQGKALRSAGDTLVDVCEGCHEEFKPDLPTEGILHVPHSNTPF
jgi:CRP/FNR family cyclic AMP-dependent transcriptional regulator